MARYYVDTCIWLDLLEDRTDGMRPLGEFAFQFIKKAMRRRGTIIYSSLVLGELMKRHAAAEIEEHCFKQLRAEHLLMKTDASVRQLQEIEETARVRQLPWSDVLHAVLARDNHATLITRDAHFQQLADVVESLKPENVSLSLLRTPYRLLP